ncbi:MAG: DEAD/DEAH box helicase [Thiotrichales bacterium]|nr:DEAD/DEAH box helicase [Thiotrichales bacterium]
MNFSDLGLSAPLIEAVSAAGYTTPTPIQAQAIPAILLGQDVMAAAQTGTGKTAGFTLPMLHNLSRGNKAKANQARALVLTPTRELALQVSESVETYGKGLPLKSAVVFGGVKINPQMQRLRSGVDVLVATPGRLLDLYQQNAIRFDHLELLVLDEADRMLDMGFIRDIKKILALLPSKRQNLLFSATFSDEIRTLAKGLVHQPIEISVTPKNSTAETVKQTVIPVDKSAKSAVLIQLIKQHSWHQVLVFTRTKHGANRLAEQLSKQGIASAAIHGNKSQNARIRALTDFKENALQVLVATDIAARGIDIDQLPHVINYELPKVAEDYVHRIGRTGRAGANGEALSLVCAEEQPELQGIENLINQLLPREILAGFEPKESVPMSKLGMKPKKPKKPKAPKVWDAQANPNRGTANDAPANSGTTKQSNDRKPTGTRRPSNPNAPRTPKASGEAGRSPNPGQRRPSRPSNRPTPSAQPNPTQNKR